MGRKVSQVKRKETALSVQQDLLQDLQRKHEESSTQFQSLTSKIKLRERELEVYDDLEKKKKDRLSSLDLKISEKNKEISSLDSKILETDLFLESYFDSEFSNYEKTIKDLKSIFSTTMNTLETLTLEIQSLEKRKQSELDIYNDLLLSNVSLRDENKRISEENYDLHSEIEKKKEIIKELESRMTTIDINLSEADLFFTELTQLRKTLMTELHNKRKVINETSTFIEELEVKQKYLAEREEELKKQETNLSRREVRARETLAKIDQVSKRLGVNITL